MANYYIADLHLGHANVIRFDQRPFADIDAMYETIARNWNAAVREQDTVYILGDFIWGKESEWPAMLSAFSGNKVLIRGNHDPREMNSRTKAFFQDIQVYKEIMDGNRHVILSHYPIPFYKHDFSENYIMLYGHVHMTREYTILRELRKQIKMHQGEDGVPLGNFINVGCMMPWMNYTPRTLDEIVTGDALASDWNNSQPEQKPNDPTAS